MTRKIVMLHAGIAAGLLWTLLACLVLEVAFRSVEAIRKDKTADTYARIEREGRLADDVIFAETAASCPPPDSVPWRAPERGIIGTLDDEGRRSLAQNRGEIIVVTDETGTVKKVFPCKDNPRLAQLGQRIAVGGNITDLLPPAEGRDAISAIRQTSFEERPIRDYVIPLDNDNVHSIEFNCIQISETPATYALFLGDSRYKDIFSGYRSNIYRRNWYAGQFTRSEFWTNSLGFRDREIEVPKPPARFRILCIGGSTTVEGPHNKLTYPKFLETRLQERFGREHIEVINCGVDGAGFQSEMERFPEWLELEPDMIVHYNLINNLATMLQLSGDAAALGEGWRGKLRRWAAKSRVLVSLRPAWFWPTDEQFSARLDETAFYWLGQMHQAAREADVVFVVSSFKVPDAESLSFPERVFFDKTFHINYFVRGDVRFLERIVRVYNTQLREFSLRNDIPYVPVAKNMHGNLENFADICHMRLNGIEEKAAIFFEYLAPKIGAMLSTSPSEAADGDRMGR